MNDFIFLSDEEWEDAQNMLDEYQECPCGDPAEWDCATCLDEYCGYCAEAHILNRHEIWKTI